MNKTKIAWTERTWNPVTGCTKYSEGCRHCYAEVMAKRLQGMGQKRYKNGFTLTLHPEALNEPKKVKKPSMFFVCSMADLFHKDVPFEFVDRVMETIAECPQHTFQILTKRIDNLYCYLIEWLDYPFQSIPENCWIGTTVENASAKERIKTLAELKDSPVRFLSCEPLLGDLGALDLAGIDWVIVGGESGQQARKMSKEWVLNIQRQCAEQGVPFFFKQWGTYGEDGVKRTKYDNGCLLDGKHLSRNAEGMERRRKISLKHITFTGIDAKTDIKALQEITEKYPIVEFGVLTSYHYYENGNRYLEPTLMGGLRDKNLNLSLHICGTAAHDASRGFWGKIIELTKDNLDIFKRCQVNIANRKDNYPYCWMASYPYQEIIIQQRNIYELKLFQVTMDLWREPAAFSVLLDASGGRGIDTAIEILNRDYKVGYAGGMNPDNVGEKLSYLMENVNGDFWIDMESGVRTNDWFDLEKVVKVLEICEPIIKKGGQR